MKIQFSTLKIVGSLLLGVLLINACDVEDEPIPAFITIEPFELTATNMSAHGSISEKITHAQIFLSDQNTGETNSLGIVETPATIPALVTGDQEIIIDPVIKANGNSLSLQIYPFYERFTESVTLLPNGDLTVNPKTTYLDDIQFKFIEDFEGNGHMFDVDRDDNPVTALESSTDDVFEGQLSGKVHLDTENDVFVTASRMDFELDISTFGKIYMEVNYKNDIPLEFGVIAIDAIGQENPRFEYIVVPRDEWNKIYFDMTDLIATAGVNRFVFIIRGGIPFENGAYTLEEADVYLDNIKLVHF